MNDQIPCEYSNAQGWTWTIETSYASDGSISGYDVDCWTHEGENRWHRFFRERAAALKEFHRWHNV